MRLTRRDALAALAGAGVVGGGGLASLARVADDDTGGDPEAALGTLVAVAEVVYPSAVEGVGAFVEAYTLTRMRERPAYREGAIGATAALDDHAGEWYDAAFADLDPGLRDAVLREMGVATVDPDPDGIAAARVRFYVVNELLYALYTSPTGGELVGIENPQGHPGGLGSYQEGPGG